MDNEEMTSPNEALKDMENRKDKIHDMVMEKSTVFGEIYRALKPGGRIIISDVLRSGEIPEELRNDPAAYTG
jgi:predicted methyltransferase